MSFISLAEGGLHADKNPGHDVLSLWTGLALGTPQGDPVCCAPGWNLSYHEIFNFRRNVFYLAGSDSLLLFSECEGQDGEIYLTPLEDSWLFGQPLLGAHAPELLREALDFFQNRYAPAFPAIVLSGVREKSLEAMRLYYLYTRDFAFYRYRSVTLCSASLAGGVDGWLSRRSGNHRQKLKKAAKKAAGAQVFFERHRPASAADAADIYQRMINVELKSWKGIEQCGMAESPAREFYGHLLANMAERRSAYVIFAMLDGVDIGFIFGNACGPIYRGQQFSYDAQFSKASIGNLLQLEKIRWLCELGFRRYDMGPITGPRMGYKAHWTEQTREIQTWLMRKK